MQPIGIIEESDTIKSSPWGAPDDVERIAEGIHLVSTPSHGGYILSPERIAEMPDALREIEPFAGTGYYEEDCDYAIVVVAFPFLFTAAALETARESLRFWRPEVAA